MLETQDKRTSKQKAKSLSVFIPTAAVLVLSAMLATPALTQVVPVFACETKDCDKDKDKDKDKCKDKDKDKCKDKDKDKCKDKDKDKKVTICHIPPGNPSNAHTIRVSENAVDAHLAHGDELGKCPPPKDDCKDKDKDKCKDS
jgi:hypothetical protein